MFDPFADTDACSVLLVVALLLFLGHRVVQQSELRAVGLRIGFCASLLNLLGLAVQSVPANLEQWLPYLVKALVTGGVTTGVAWILLPAWSFIHACTLGKWYRDTRGFFGRRQMLYNERLRLRREQEAWRQQAPQRELERQQALAQAHAAGEARRRREQARFDITTLYDLHSQEIHARFPRERLEKLIDHYLSDDRPDDEIDHYAQHLKQLLGQHFNLAAPPPRFATLPEIATHYTVHRSEIDALPYDDDVKDTLRIVIAKQEEDAIRELLRK